MVSLVAGARLALGIDGRNTPWYPAMRLFRQSKLGDWHSVFEGMAAQLRRESYRLSKVPAGELV